MSAPAPIRPFAGSVVFEVVGEPVPQGRMTGYVVGKRAVVTASNKGRLGPWRQQIAAAAAEVIDEPHAGPVELGLAFTFARPKSHYRTGAHAGELKPGSPRHQMTRPDLDKLARAVLDALTGIAFRDDGQVSVLLATKRFGERAGVTVTVSSLEAER